MVKQCLSFPFLFRVPRCVVNDGETVSKAVKKITVAFVVVEIKLGLVHVANLT